ncbi:MAG: sugar phosphate isomerase/epimerase [Anaerolineae bacterium]|nr:sugar phosphate isomerase/epimerase [Anaerolineae bacterium]
MKLSFTTLGCPGWTLRQIVENAVSMGYDGVDLRGLLDQIDVTQRPEFSTHLTETKQLFADHGVAISGLALSSRFAVPDPTELGKQMDELRRNMELAAKLDAHIVRVYGGRVPEGYTVDSIMPIVVENLRQAGDEAEEYDITLALETHDDWTDSTVFARLMREVDHPRVRVLWDLHHPFRTTGEAPELTYANLAPYTVSTHVKDSRPTAFTRPDPAARGGHTYVLLGEGDVPLKTMLDLLVAGGYDGYAILEWEKRWIPTLAEPETVFPQYVNKMREWGF